MDSKIPGPSSCPSPFLIPSDGWPCAPVPQFRNPQYYDESPAPLWIISPEPFVNASASYISISTFCSGLDLIRMENLFCLNFLPNFLSIISNTGRTAVLRHYYRKIHSRKSLLTKTC